MKKGLAEGWVCEPEHFQKANCVLDPIGTTLKDMEKRFKNYNWKISTGLEMESPKHSGIWQMAAGWFFLGFKLQSSSGLVISTLEMTS